MAPSSSAFDLRSLRGVVACSVSCVALCACDPQITQPALADLGATLAAYESPRGVLTRDNVEALVARAAPRLQSLALANPQQLFVAVVNDLDPELAARGIVDSEAEERQALSIDASIRLRVACPGADPATAAGSLDLVTRVDDNVLANVIQGHAYTCMFPSSRDRAAASSAASTLDGDVFLYRYESTSAEVADARFLLVVEGALSSTSADGAELRDFDTRLLGPVIETRFDVGGAEVVAFLDGATFGIRDARDRYTCVLETRTCSSSEGDTLAW